MRVARAKAVWQQENRYAADKDVIARAIGYSGLNGKSLGIISAMLKYGLLEPVGNQLRLTKNAIDLAIHSPGDPERVAAIRHAALLPSLFSDLHDHYGDVPPRDQNLRSYLVKRGFNPQTVDGVIRAYRDTMAFVEQETGGFASEAEDDLFPRGRYAGTDSRTASDQCGQNGRKYGQHHAISGPGRADALVQPSARNRGALGVPRPGHTRSHPEVYPALRGEPRHIPEAERYGSPA
jgi:hypothetical protein